MDRKPDPSWLKDPRAWGTAVVCLIAGFLIGWLIFGASRNLSPDWGDIPTWLLVILGAVGGYAALQQLSSLQKQIREETARNVKRDELLDTQLSAERRKQAEAVKARKGTDKVDTWGFADNGSGRPITDVTCKIMSRATGRPVASPDKYGETVTSKGQFGGAQVPVRESVPREERGPRCQRLRPGKNCRFTFTSLSPEEDHVAVVWFTDDAGLRWQLDEYQHLAETTGDEYRP